MLFLSLFDPFVMKVLAGADAKALSPSKRIWFIFAGADQQVAGHPQRPWLFSCLQLVLSLSSHFISLLHPIHSSHSFLSFIPFHFLVCSQLFPFPPGDMQGLNARLSRRVENYSERRRHQRSFSAQQCLDSVRLQCCTELAAAFGDQEKPVISITVYFSCRTDQPPAEVLCSQTARGAPVEVNSKSTVCVASSFLCSPFPLCASGPA